MISLFLEMNQTKSKEHEMNTFKAILTATLILFLAAGLFPSEDNFLLQYKRADKAGDHAKALEILDKMFKELTPSEGLYKLKSRTLVKMQRYPEALEAAVKRTELAVRKSPWHCIDIIDIAIKMNDIDTAFQWLDKAIERGFLSYTALDEEQYKPLHKDKRYAAAIQRIKDNIGIGKPAQDFTVTLMDGTSFTLSKQKGKVILIDFWATWCHPCRKGLPHLKEFYAEYKTKGFEIIGISLDSRAQDLTNFLKTSPLPWKLLFTNNGWFDPTARQYNVNLIPSYWLIDRTGTLRHFGLPLRDKTTLKKAIEELLAE